ncbi:unnamed protein product [Schistosoma mattheei]|uniref:DUF148 domain-containing protein n=1 Tax=Schistosoma mattheei TaxID=31246 RepID=A0AA85C2H9_9TREM|nr:unnamed protein product [Schistosoma mattheei]
MYRTLLFIVSFFTFSLINLSIQDVEHLRSKKLSIEYSLEQNRNQTKQDVKYAIDALDEIETLQNEFNKGISGNNKSINNYIECCRIKAEAFFGASLMTRVIIPESSKLIDCYNEQQSIYKQIRSKYAKDACIGHSTYPRKVTYEFQLNIANEITKRLSKYEKLIMKKDDIEFNFQNSERMP